MIYETDCFALQMNFVNIYVKMTQTLAGDADAFKPLSPSLPACLHTASSPSEQTGWPSPDHPDSIRVTARFSGYGSGRAAGSLEHFGLKTSASYEHLQH